MRRWTIPELEWISPAVDRDAVLTVESLAVRYGRRPAVHEVSLHVRAGEVVGLVGHNGCGKTSVAAAAHIADRVYVLNSGRLRSEHTGRDLLAGGPRSWWRLL